MDYSAINFNAGFMSELWLTTILQDTRTRACCTEVGKSMPSECLANYHVIDQERFIHDCPELVMRLSTPPPLPAFVLRILIRLVPRCQDAERRVRLLQQNVRCSEVPLLEPEFHPFMADRRQCPHRLTVSCAVRGLIAGRQATSLMNTLEEVQDLDRWLGFDLILVTEVEET